MKRFLFKRKLDQILSKGSGEQLWWLLAITCIIIVIANIIVCFYFNDGEMTWEDVIAIFIDSGYSLESGAHYWFRLILAIISTFVFSALLISVFTNIFDNIAESVRRGERRYNLKDHVIVIGRGENVKNVVSELSKKGKTVVLLSEEDPEVENDIYYYRGSQTNWKDIVSTGPSFAESIYVFGDATNFDHDTQNIQTLNLLKKAVPASGRKVHCYLTIRQNTTKEVFQFMKNVSQTANTGSGLVVDVIDEFEYQAEQLLVATDFLPVLHSGEDRYARFFIIGSGQLAMTTAMELAHICHYPSYSEYGRKSIITMIDSSIQDCYMTMLAAHPVLFEMSHYKFVAADGKETVHTPDVNQDFLDIEWEFIETGYHNPVARNIMSTAAREKKAETRVLVCLQDSHNSIECALHLPLEVYSESQIALYLNDSAEVIKLAVSTGMYGKMMLFGQSNSLISDMLLEQRVKAGQRVNYVYHRAYADKIADSAEEAWYSISEADKCSSVSCASALQLRKKCFDFNGNRMPIYEAEHRRWMMSALLMGYKPGPKKDKEKFIHPDIIPFDALPDSEKEKDKILIDAIDEITKNR